MAESVVVSSKGEGTTESPAPAPDPASPLFPDSEVREFVSILYVVMAAKFGWKLGKKEHYKLLSILPSDLASSKNTSKRTMAYSRWRRLYEIAYDEGGGIYLNYKQPKIVESFGLDDDGSRAFPSSHPPNRDSF